jgi:hypothetical protein
MSRHALFLTTVITLSLIGLGFAVYLLYRTLNPACITDSPDRFLLQSADVRIADGLLQNKVKVVVFWKTDDQASQSTLRVVDSISSAGDYNNRPVSVIAVHSDEETKAYFAWWRKYPWDYDHMYGFHDSHGCMKANYQISEYPQVLIFDRKDRLVVKDANLTSIQATVENLLKQP